MALIRILGIVEDGAPSGPTVPENARVPVLMPRGSTLVLGVTVVNRDGSPVSLESPTVLELRVKYASRFANVVLQKTAVPSGPVGYAEFTIAADETRFVDPGRYVYDVFLTQPSGARNAVVPLSAFVITSSLVYP